MPTCKLTTSIGISRHGGRKWCIGVDGSTFKWKCPKCGHTWKDTVKIGPRGFRKPINRELAAKFARYWSEENGGANAVCPKCEKGKG